MSRQKRQPAAFVLDETAPDAPKTRTARQPTAAPVEVVEEAAPALPQTVEKDTAARAGAHMRRAFRWGRVLASAAFGLFTLWAGAAITTMVENLFARSAILGWTALALAGIAAIALLIITGRELIGLARLRRIARLHDEAALALESDDQEAMGKVLKKLENLYSGRASMRWAIQRMAAHEEAIMTPAQRLQLAEKELLAPLDEQASRIIARTARQVAVMTAILPMAALDMAAVSIQNLKMLRALASLYGGRPGLLGGLKLGGMVMTHLALTGSLALTDSVIQNVLGKGLAGRLSARFGEGAVNGILTARIGIATLQLLRPLPWRATSPPSLSDYARMLFAKDPGKAQND